MSVGSAVGKGVGSGEGAVGAMVGSTVGEDELVTDTAIMEMKPLPPLVPGAPPYPLPATKLESVVPYGKADVKLLPEVPA